jgi:hypothetical protein
MSSVTQMLVEPIVVSIFPDGRMDVKNAARYLGLKEKTLAMFRSQGCGPQFIKRGHIFYFKEDLDAWINAAGKLLSTTQMGKTPKENKNDQ